MKKTKVSEEKVKERKTASVVWIKVLSPPYEGISNDELVTFIVSKALLKLRNVSVGMVKAAHLGDVGVIFKIAKIEPEGANIVTPETKVATLKTANILRPGYTEIETSEYLFWNNEVKELLINALKGVVETSKKGLWQLFDNTFLLAGPPGNGKSQGAVTLGRELGFDVYEVDIPSLVGNKFAGETAEKIMLLKEEVMRLKTPALIIFNDFEILAAGYYYASIYGGFFEIRTSILTFLDKIKSLRKPLAVIGTSNMPPEYLDEAILDRFALRLVIAPTLREKKRFAEYLLRKMKDYITVEVNISELEDFLNEMSLRSIKSAIRQSSNVALVNKTALTTDLIKETIKRMLENKHMWRYYQKDRGKLPHYI